MKGDVNMPTLINETEVEKIIKDQISDKVNQYFKSIEIWWSIKEFNDHCVHKDLKWIKHHILDPYHDEIDVKNGGFVRFSIGGSSKTWFEARKSVEWVHDNYLKLDWEAKL